MDDTVVLFLLGGSGFERICLQVGTVNRWLPERCFGFVFFLALIGKLSTNRTVLLQKKNKQTDETQKVLRPHLCLSSRYGAPAALRRIILRSFLKRSIIYIKIYIYVLKGANQPQAGHVTGHADLKSYQIFFKRSSIYADVIQNFLPV